MRQKQKRFETASDVATWIRNNADEVRAALLVFERPTAAIDAGTSRLLSVKDAMQMIVAEAIAMRSKRSQVVKAE